MILYKEFYDARKELGSKVSEYVARVDFVAKKIRNAGEAITDDTAISRIVTGLSADYRHFMSSWMGIAKNERNFANLPKKQ